MADQTDGVSQTNPYEDPTGASEPTNVELEDVGEEILYSPEPNEPQLTLRAVAAGCLLGGVVASMNIYFGLKTGWSLGGSLIAAILGFALFAFLGSVFNIRKYSVLETNITQTSGSAAGSMTSAAGLLSAIPALQLLGHRELAFWEMLCWALAVGYLGVFFAVPLRNQMVVVEKLRFPTGTATAETIMSMFAVGGKAIAQAKALVYIGVAAFAFTILAYLFPQAGHPPLEDIPFLRETFVAVFAAWGFSILISPMMIGAGLLIGPRIGISLLLGAIVSWGVVGPLISRAGWVDDPAAIMSYKEGARGWILWPGVAIMIADALTNLALSWRTILSTFKKSDAEAMGMESVEDRVPNSWWLGGLAFGSVMTIVIAYRVFEIEWWMTCVAIAMSSVLAMIAVRSVGETDINPIGGMGKVTQLAFGGMDPGSTTTNVMAAAITSGGASQAGDMMQDLKTGRLLGATPRKQIIAQCVGILAGIPISVGIYKLFMMAGKTDPTFEIGGENLPAPAAFSWKAMAEVLSKGWSELPTNAVWAVAVGALFGIAIPIIKKLAGKKGKYVPSALAFGIAFIVPAYYSVAMFAGSMLLLVWSKKWPKSCGIFAIAIASGLVAGEGLAGVLSAVMSLIGIESIT